MPFGQVTAEICLPDGEAYQPWPIGHGFVDPWHGSSGVW